MKWQIVCKLVMVLPMKSSTKDLAFIKFVQDASHNNSQCCTNNRARTSANKIWIAMINKLMPSLDRIITRDETWVHHYEPECKRQIMKWKHSQSPSRKKFKSQPSARKLMLTVFLGLTRPHTGTLSGEGFNNKQCSLE